MNAPCLAADVLASLSWPARMQAYSDFDQALANWRMARHSRAAGDYGWHLDMRRARRFWKLYAKAVRAAKAGRIAA